MAHDQREGRIQTYDEKTGRRGYRVNQWTAINLEVERFVQTKIGIWPADGKAKTQRGIHWYEAVILENRRVFVDVVIDYRERRSTDRHREWYAGDNQQCRTCPIRHGIDLITP